MPALSAAADDLLPEARGLLLSAELPDTSDGGSSRWSVDVPPSRRPGHIEEFLHTKGWCRALVLTLAVVAALLAFGAARSGSGPPSLAVFRRGSIDAIGAQASADGALRDAGEGAEEGEDADRDEADCQDAVLGGRCFRYVTWAMMHGIYQKPEDYFGLSSTSSFKQFQKLLHLEHRGSCAMPCGLPAERRWAQPPPGPAAPPGTSERTSSTEDSSTTHARTTSTTRATTSTHTTAAAQRDPRNFGTKGLGEGGADGASPVVPVKSKDMACKDALPGDQCYVFVKWAMRTGILAHPDWYKGLTRQSTFADFQRLLNKEHHGACRAPCPGDHSADEAMRSPFRDVSDAEECFDPQVGEQCFIAVTWAKNEGVREHPEWYVPLNRTSTFREFQVLLHDEGHGGCGLPCPLGGSSTTTTTTVRTRTTTRRTTSTVTTTRRTTTTRTTLESTTTRPQLTARPGETLVPTEAPVTERSTSTRTHSKTATVTTTRTATSTTKTSTSSTSTTTSPCIPERAIARPSLFCFSVMQMAGPELDLVKSQFEKRASIFACNDFAVISAKRMTLGQDECGVDQWTWVNDLPQVPIGVLGQEGVTTNSYLNTKTFIEAWDTLMNSGKLWPHDFAVKVDPDCVFFPPRLRPHLEPQVGARAYILNCQWYGQAHIFGALEVFSTPALRKYSAQPMLCKNMTWQGWGEDLYMESCMNGLATSAIEDFNLVGDNRCRGAPCSDATKVAFHPYKDTGSYWSCYDQSQSSESDHLTVWH